MLRISVALATYNGSAYLKEQLHSIAAQTRLPSEVVVCDDLSTDETSRIVEEFAAAAPFPVRFFRNQTNLGSTKNFERAIGLCEGDLISLCDQDDVWLPEKLEKLETSLLAAPDSQLSFCDGDVVDENLRPMNWRIWETIRFDRNEQQLFAGGKALEVLLDHNVVTGAAMLFRADFRDLVLPFPVDLMHDGWKVIHDGWIALLAAAVSKLIFVAEPLIKYRQHSHQQLGVLSAIADSNVPPPRFTIDGALASARRQNTFSPEIHFLKTIEGRLAANDTKYSSEAARAELKTRIDHLETRADMSRSFANRVPTVLRELLTFRYHRYSNGWSSAAKDLWSM